ncbi:MAG: hypothetical protein ACJA1A_000381 [Saprospiraceae bacterium]|jgi:hypothetical protein|tara:strand:- start:1199 stop:2740 length:1542 start_codon:yes stop_codon:yes gene_type:complete
MENKEFDNIIKKKLESLNSGGTDDGWELFREKWEQSSVSTNSDILDSKEKESVKVDELFDAKMKQNMRGLRMPFNSAHWVKLKALLEAEALFKKRLFVAKTVEILMLALIVVGVLNVMPIQNEIYQIPVFDVPMVAAIQVDKATAEKHQAESIQKSKKQSIVSDRVIKKLTNLDVASLFNTKPKKISIKSNQNHTSKSQNRRLETTLSPNLKLLFPFLKDSEYNKAIFIDHQVSQLPQSLDNSITGVIKKDFSPLILPNRPIGIPDMILGASKDRSDENSYLSLAIGPKINLVNSPFDPVYEIDPYNTLNTNFNITAKVHKEVGPLELYAGLGYSKTSYEPLIIEETYKNQNQQYKQTSLENIGFNTLNVPLGVKYNVLDKDNYQLYASAGVDVNFIAQTEYIVYDIPATAAELGKSSPAIKSFINSGKPEVNRRTLLSQKEFKRGILDGGQLRDNLYATASIGVGLIRNVSENASLFIEPKYSHFMTSQGLGPNLDKVHSVSVDVGIRYQLN